MIRYVKHILLVFGSLGCLLVCFFYLQNKHDLQLYFSQGSKLDYETLKESCEKVQQNYYYPCFRENFVDLISNLSVTGRSLALKKAFNFIELDKKKERDI